MPPPYPLGRHEYADALLMRICYIYLPPYHATARQEIELFNETMLRLLLIGLCACHAARTTILDNVTPFATAFSTATTAA